MIRIQTQTLRRTSILACASTLVLGLAACKVDNRPLLARGGPEPAYVSSALPAPGPLDLAYAPPVQVAPLEEPYDAYAWAERAYGLDRAFYQSEPDYGFAYGDVQPWGWESPDDWTMYAEPIDDGYRFYYYEPEAEHPYFVRDDRYGYGYNDDGVLVALFTLAGALLPQSYLYDNADVAGRYYYRGEDLRRTARRERRMAVQDDYWRDRAPILVAAQTPWIQAAAQQPEWRSYRARTEERDLRQFERERQRRAPRIERAIEPDGRTLAALANPEPYRQGRDFDREQRRAERPDRGFQQQIREQQRQAERSRDDGQRMARLERDQARENQRAQRDQAENGRRQAEARAQRDQAREAERQQRAQREQAENGRRRAEARAQRDQARQVERQQREQRQQAENGRRQEEARAQREQARQAERQQREQAENGRRQQQEQARNAERHAQQAAARQQQQARPERGQGGGGGREERGGGGGNGKGGGRGKD